MIQGRTDYASVTLKSAWQMSSNHPLQALEDIDGVCICRRAFLDRPQHALKAAPHLRVTDSVLAPIHRDLPPLGGLDLSFLVLFLLIKLVRHVLIPNVIDIARV